METRTPVTSLVLNSPDANTAQVVISTIEPGTLFIDIGIGLHGEWLIRDEKQLADALADLGRLFEGVFRGQVTEDVRPRLGGRLSIHGTVETPSKKYNFTHHAVGIRDATAGHRRYESYPPIAR